MSIIAVANQKGGCGKTTTAINLAACLGRKHKRTLLIDTDPQGQASLGFGTKCSDYPGLFEVFTGEEHINEVIILNVAANVDLIPATMSLAAVEQIFIDKMKDERLLLSHIEKLETAYDYIVFDCAPTMGMLFINVLRASKQILVPIEMSLFSFNGIDRLHKIITSVAEKYDIELAIRMLPTLVDNRTRLCRHFLRQLWEKFPDEILPVMVHHTIRLKEAVSAGKPIIDYMPKSIASHDYNKLAAELILLSEESSEEDVLLMEEQRSINEVEQQVSANQL